MSPTRSRSLLTAAALGAAALVGTVAAVPASAEEQVGRLRLSPASGTIDTAMDALSETPCPGGTHVVVRVSGPGVPARGDIGNILGNTSIAALPPTESGQLYVPLQYTLRDWFGRNVPGTTPRGTYTLTLVCRDAYRSAVTFGSFAAQVRVDARGAYRALGEAAAPFDTTKATGPLGGAAPGGPAEPAPSAAPSVAASSPASPPSGGAPSAPAAPAGAVPSSGAEGTAPPTRQPDSGSVVEPGPVAAEPVPTGAAATSWLPAVLVGLGAAVLAFAVLSSRRAPAAASDERAPRSGGTRGASGRPHGGGR